MSNSGSSADLFRRQLKGRRAIAAITAVVLGTLAAPHCSFGWSADGHRKVSDLAARVAVGTSIGMPDFFRGGSEQIADASVEPDVRRNRRTPQLRAREYPEHYIDLELLQGAELPATRYEYVDLVRGMNVAVASVGTVPYAIVESTQHLALAFAEHRARPEDRFIQAKVLYLAGVLSHYSADMSQPLHTTIHHNGRARPDNSSPGTGIHHRVDSLIGRAAPALSPLPGEPWPLPYGDVWTAILQHLRASHGLVDQVYALESDLAWDENAETPVEPPPAIGTFASERLMASVSFTARLFASAWELSADLELPDWRFDSPYPQPE